MKKISLLVISILGTFLLHPRLTSAVTAKGLLETMYFSICMEGETHCLTNPCNQSDSVFLIIDFVDPQLIGAYVEVEGTETGIVCEIIDVDEITLLDDQNLDDNYPPVGNNCPDVCECEGNFDDDYDQDGTDAATFKADFGRSKISNPCTNAIPCNGDFDCDVDVDGLNASQFKQDFGRSSLQNPCPVCETGVEWCNYSITGSTIEPISTTTTVTPCAIQIVSNYNRPGRRGVPATCGDVIEVTICTDCPSFDSSCLMWNISPDATWLSIEQSNDCSWSLIIGDTCQQCDNSGEYGITVTDTCNNVSDTLIIEMH